MYGMKNRMVDHRITPFKPSHTHHPTQPQHTPSSPLLAPPAVVSSGERLTGGRQSRRVACWWRKRATRKGAEGAERKCRGRRRNTTHDSRFQHLRGLSAASACAPTSRALCVCVYVLVYALNENSGYRTRMRTSQGASVPARASYQHPRTRDHPYNM